MNWTTKDAPWHQVIAALGTDADEPRLVLTETEVEELAYTIQAIATAFENGDDREVAEGLEELVQWCQDTEKGRDTETAPTPSPDPTPIVYDCQPATNPKSNCPMCSGSGVGWFGFTCSCGGGK